MEYLLLALGLTIIVIGAMILTDGSVALAERFGMPEFIIGLTVVAVGTSMPELSVSVLSAIKGNSDMAIGNVVGSNIFNTFVILGVCAMIAPIVFSRTNIRRDIPLCIAASLMLGIFTLGETVHPHWSSSISRIEGIAMLVCYAGMIWYSLHVESRCRDKESDYLKTSGKRRTPLWQSILFVVAGLAALIFGGDMCVRNASAIARSLGVSESVIAITIVAGGTSLPELASSVAAVVKHRPSLALGNVLGSNMANILLVLGASATVRPLELKGVTMSDIWFSVIGSILLLVSAVAIGRNKMTRIEGVLMLSIYIVYIATLLR
ncbi:MAG: calcium/sodium antiporter [Alistipes sp.]|nr:calcium/sodium antiporter [Alistipes sp.]MDE7129749.1 calcium/sodium antiporter [Alistipes sp.]